MESEINNNQYFIFHLNKINFINFMFRLYDVKINSFRFRPNSTFSVEIFLKTLGRIQIF